MMTASRRVQSPSCWSGRLWECGGLWECGTSWSFFEAKGYQETIGVKRNLAERKKDSFKEGRGLEEGLLEGHEEMEVQPLELANVVTDTREQDEVEESEL
jgi:hypothetical protein